MTTGDLSKSAPGSSSERKLAAIMFTDIVGYTALTQADEARALALLERHNSFLRPIFQKYHGQEIKTIGDAFLVEFESALEASQCAIEIQEFLHDYNISSDEGWHIRIRIGVHLGDVVRSGNDVFGDAVNIASRIQPLAEPEGICISEQVFDQVQNKLRLSLEKLGIADLKNVRFPTAVYQIVLPWENSAGSSEKKMTEEFDRKRIAVLPFDNISPNPNDAYFSDGMTEEIISTISKISGLQVIARTSILRYKNSNKGIEEIGKELEVGSILEGSVRMAGDKLRITTQLIETKRNHHIWSDSYDRRLDDVFAIQSDIAKRVADVLQVKLIGSEQARIESRATDNIDAYTLYLRASQKLYARANEAIHEAMLLFELSIKKDPKFARSYAGLAACYLILLDHGQLPFSEALPKTREYANMALRIDPELPEAHTVLGSALEHDYDPFAAEIGYKLAIRLNPNNATAHHWYAISLNSQGRYKEAIREMEKALAADPYSPIIRTVLGSTLFDASRYDDAWRVFEEALKVDPDFYVLYLWRSIWFVKFSRLEEAKREITKGVHLVPGHSRVLGVMGYILAAKGETAEARKILKELLESKSFVSGECLAFVYAGLKERDKFFESLSIAVKDRTVPQYLLRRLPIFDEYRKDPRFEEILRRA
ncbi:MAG TPA: adenylate/guanylate cyclase domain-containing protein, partial [Nitrososphaerales archaeon]|nr:adenylate/guanylate cyclase domain-containing protein [Nitrososphaerales archaeon]